MSTKKYEVVHPNQYFKGANGQEKIPCGTIVELSDEKAKRLLEKGRIKIYGGEVRVLDDEIEAAEEKPAKKAKAKG